ncbi:MAG: DUF4143 domain-containing protein [bacterium]
MQTYVERDVRQLSQITDLVAFRTLAQLAALRTGQVLVISTLGRDAKLNAVTAGRYLDLLEASFLIRRLPPFSKNRSSRRMRRRIWLPCWRHIYRAPSLPSGTSRVGTKWIL